MKSWTEPCSEMIHSYCLKQFTALHESLTEDESNLEWVTKGRMVLIKKEPWKGDDSIQLLANNLTLNNMEAPVRHPSGQDSIDEQGPERSW